MVSSLACLNTVDLISRTPTQGKLVDAIKNIEKSIVDT